MQRLIYIVLLCLAVVMAGGCKSSGRQPDKTSQNVYQVTDYRGHVVKLAGKPQRIVSLSVGTDEVVVDLVQADRIAGLTYLVDDPGISNVSDKVKGIGSRVKANAEQLVSLQPDLILMPHWQPEELADTLRNMGLPVYVYHAPSSIDGIRRMVAELAQVLGEEEGGQRLVAQMDAMLAEVSGKVNRIPPDERLTAVRFTLLGASGGNGSLFDDICRYAAVNNGAALAGLGPYDIMSKEQMIKVNPDFLIMPVWDATGQDDTAAYAESVRRDPGLQSIKAVVDNRLIMLTDRYQNSASHYAVYAVRDVAQAAYPALDWSK